MRSFDCVENILSALWRRYVCDDVVRLTSGVAHREYVLILQQSKSRSSYLYPVEHPSIVGYHHGATAATTTTALQWRLVIPARYFYGRTHNNKSYS